MGHLNHSIGVILYNPADQTMLFHRKADGKLEPASADWNARCSWHQSETAAGVLGPNNYATLLKTIQQYKNGTTKVEDTSNRQVIYIANTPANGTMTIPPELHCEWIPIRDVIDAVKAKTLPAAAVSASQFSREFLDSAPLLLGADKSTNILRQLVKDKSVCGTVKGNPSKASSIVCDLRGSGNDPNIDPIDEEFVPIVDWDNNRFTVEGSTYEISFKQCGKDVSLAKLDPTFKRQLLTTLRDAVRKAAPKDKLSAIESVVFNFKAAALSNAEFFGGDPDNAVHSVFETDPVLSPFKDQLNQLHKDLTQQVTKRNIRSSGGVPIRGIPSKYQTSWLGSGIHLAINLYGHHLERIVRQADFRTLFTPDQQDLVHHLLDLKHKLFKEVNGAITHEDIDTLIELIQDFIDIDALNHPIQFAEQLCYYLDLDTQLDSNLIDILPPAPQVRNGPKEVVNLTKEVINKGIEQDSTEIQVHINRQDVSGKNSEPVQIEKQITLDNGDVFELVSAVIHHGTDIQSGHYSSISFRNGAFWRCNDKHIEQVEDDAELETELNTNATDLVYRKIATPHQAHEDSIQALHSQSRRDTDKWLGKSLLFDYAEQLLAHNPQCKLLEKADGTSYRIGEETDLAALPNIIRSSQENFLVIPTHKNGKHWTMLIVDKVSQRVEYFDSVGREAPQDVKDMCNELGYTLFHVLDKDTKWQADGWRCGLYVLQYLELRLRCQPEDIQTFVDLQCHNIDTITNFRGRLQNKYNRYEPNYGFIQPKP